MMTSSKPTSRKGARVAPLAEPAFLIEVDDDGKQGLREFTDKHIGEAVDFYINGKLVLSPMIREPIVDGRVQVCGGLNPAERDAMVTRLPSDGRGIKVGLWIETWGRMSTRPHHRSDGEILQYLSGLQTFRDPAQLAAAPRPGQDFRGVDTWTQLNGMAWRRPVPAA